MRPCRALIDLKALRHNAQLARRLAPRSKLMAVVKANAYGHGAAPVAAALEPLVDAMAVASIDEALVLREAGVQSPILLLEGVFCADEIQLAQQHGFWLAVDNQHQLDWLERAKLPAPVRAWLKLDSGMHRLGVTPEETDAAYRRLKACPQVDENLVLFTHFANADDIDSPQTADQLRLFNNSCAEHEGLRSAANSPAVLAWPEAHLDWIRPGYMLYGNSPFDHQQASASELQPVMTLRSNIISLRDLPVGAAVGYGASWTARRPSRIATATMGYGDGYPRAAGSGTPVLVKGQRAVLAGRVSMDMITIDVTDLNQVDVGDEVTLWGPELTVGEVAAHAGTIGYELTTRMPQRVERVYLDQ